MQGIAQYVIIAFVLIFNLYVLYVLRKEQIDYQYALMWILAGLVMLVFSLFPPLIDRLAGLIGIGLPVNFLFFMSILILFLIAFRISITISRLKRMIYTLTQNLALLDREVRQAPCGQVCAGGTGDPAVICPDGKLPDCDQKTGTLSSEAVTSTRPDGTLSSEAVTSTRPDGTLSRETVTKTRPVDGQSRTDSRPERS